MLLKCKYITYFYQMKRALQVLEDNEMINSESTCHRQAAYVTTKK